MEPKIETLPDTEQFEIESPKKKLFLVPLETGRKRLFVRERVYATVNAKYGMLSLGGAAATAMGMQKSWYKMAFDSGNRVIAWKIRSELSKEQMESKAWKFVKANSSGSIQIAVKRILDTFQALEEKSYPKLEIKSYQDPKSILDGDKYYYVEIPTK